MVVVNVPRNWREHTDGNVRFHLDAGTVGGAISSLVDAHPGLERWLDNGTGNVPSYTHVFLGEVDVRILDGNDTVVGTDDELRFLVDMSGGSAG